MFFEVAVIRLLFSQYLLISLNSLIIQVFVKSLFSRLSPNCCISSFLCFYQFNSIYHISLILLIWKVYHFLLKFTDFFIFLVSTVFPPQYEASQNPCNKLCNNMSRNKTPRQAGKGNKVCLFLFTVFNIHMCPLFPLFFMPAHDSYAYVMLCLFSCHREASLLLIIVEKSLKNQRLISN